MNDTPSGEDRWGGWLHHLISSCSHTKLLAQLHRVRTRCHRIHELLLRPTLACCLTREFCPAARSPGFFDATGVSEMNLRLPLGAEPPAAAVTGALAVSVVGPVGLPEVTGPDSCPEDTRTVPAPWPPPEPLPDPPA